MQTYIQYEKNYGHVQNEMLTLSKTQGKFYSYRSRQSDKQINGPEH